MSQDKLDKNGVWQGTQEEYFEFSKEIIQDACNNQGHYNIDAILKDILLSIPQDKLESIISEHCGYISNDLDGDMSDTRLGLIMKANEGEVFAKGENDVNNS